MCTVLVLIPALFLCREYEENGEIKKETKYSYGKLINRKSLPFYACNFGLLCVCVYFDFCCKTCIFFLGKKGMQRNKQKFSFVNKWQNLPFLR